MKIKTTCKFCGCDIEARADDECPKEWVDALVPMLCCNRCGDYREWKTRRIEAIKHICYDWSFKEEAAKKRDRDATFAKLETITKNLVWYVARFHRASMAWDRSFVEHLMEAPHKAEYAINAFEYECKRQGSVTAK